MEYMKKYVPIIIGIVALCAVVYVGDKQMKKHDAIAKEEQKSSVSDKSFQGSVTKVFEGDNTLMYGFNIPETATATVTRDGTLIKVTDGGVALLAMYTSFEGARGYTPADYIVQNIVPKVRVVNDNGTTTIGSYDWTVVASEKTEWHVASVANGQWLVVVESSKGDTEKVITLLESLATEAKNIVQAPSVIESSTSTQ